MDLCVWSLYRGHNANLRSFGVGYVSATRLWSLYRGIVLVSTGQHFPFLWFTLSFGRYREVIQSPVYRILLAPLGRGK